MNKSESLVKFAPSFLKAQKAISAASKSATNPFFRSNYADLESVIGAVKDPLNENGLAFMQLVQRDDLGDYVETVLLHESEEFVTSESSVRSKDANDPQKMGSGITYAKRYALQAMCGLPTEDDDGNAAAKPPKKPVKPPVKPAKPAKAVDDDTIKGAREELDGLIEKHDISGETKAGWLKHFKAKSIGALSYEAVEKIIKGVEKKYAK